MHRTQNTTRNALLVALLLTAVPADASQAPRVLGRCALGLGDLDGDGTPDFAAGAYGRAGTPDDRDVVLILSGATREVLQTWRGEATREGFGESLRDAGDVNGDGTGDVLVGYGWQARCEVRSGLDGELLLAFDRVPWKVLALGDANGDGCADLLLHHDNKLEIRSGAGGGFLGSVSPSMPEGRLSPVGDLNGDGLTDLVSGGKDGKLCLSDAPQPTTDAPRDNAKWDCDLYPLAYRTPVARLWPDIFRARQVRSYSLEQASLERVSAGPGGDLNGDGSPNLLLFLSWGKTSTVAPLSRKSTQPLFEMKGLPGHRDRVLVGRDLNGDGYEDIVSAQSWNVLTVQVRANSGRDGALLWKSSWEDLGVTTRLELAWLEQPTGIAGVLVSTTSEVPRAGGPRLGELRLLAGSTGATRWEENRSQEE